MIKTAPNDKNQEKLHACLSLLLLWIYVPLGNNIPIFIQQFTGPMIAFRVWVSRIIMESTPVMLLAKNPERTQVDIPDFHI